MQCPIVVDTLAIYHETIQPSLPLHCSAARIQTQILSHKHMCGSQVPSSFSHVLPPQTSCRGWSRSLLQLPCCTCPPQRGESPPLSVYSPYQRGMDILLGSHCTPFQFFGIASCLRQHVGKWPGPGQASLLMRPRAPSSVPDEHSRRLMDSSSMSQSSASANIT